MSDDSLNTALSAASVDLVAAARQGILPPVSYRDREIDTLLGQLDAGHSVLITGPAGCGKTSVIFGLAAALSQRQQGGLCQLSTSSVMAGTRYLGDWETKLAKICEQAEENRVILYFSDPWNLASVGRSTANRNCFLDALRPLLEAGRVRLLGEASAEQIQAMRRHADLLHLFQTLPVTPLGEDEVQAIITNTARDAGLALEPTALRTLIQLTNRFLPARPQPGPALQLLGQARDYQTQKAGVGEPEGLSSAFIEKVFGIYSGLPRFVVSADAVMPAQEIREWFQQRIIGQEEAVEAVVETITLFKAGLHDPQRPLGSFLFVGPTGVGKTELARALAEFLFGSAARLLRFDLSEFKDYHAFEMLLGDPGNPDQPARLLDPVRDQPFQVILFDELEKAHPNIWDIFLQLLDAGRLSPPGGEPVDFRNTLVIATSNVGAEAAGSTMGFVTDDRLAARQAGIRQALEKAFRAEFLNRFQHTVVFHPLTREQIRAVARQELQRILNREGITARQLVVDVDDAALDLTVARGFDPRYGARGLSREIQRRLLVPLATLLMERGTEEGQILRLVAQRNEIQVRVVDTPVSRAARRARAPLRLARGRRLQSEDLVGQIRELGDNLEQLTDALGETSLQGQHDALLERKDSPGFWTDPAAAALVLQEINKLAGALSRLTALREAQQTLATEFADSGRRNLPVLHRRWEELANALASARRELLILGEAGLPDALVEIRPVGGRLARDLLAETYRRWASAHHHRVECLHGPMADDDPLSLVISGAYAYGMLRGELGLHRVREGERSGVAAVRVGPLVDAPPASPSFSDQRALKKVDQYGEKVRSRVVCGEGLVLQNSRTLAENRERAADLLPSWEALPAISERIVRRYELKPFKVRDYLSNTTSGKASILAPEQFHQLLCQRVELGDSPPSSPQ